MSDLREFKSSDDFRKQLKKFLLKERNLTAQKPKPEAVVNTQRYSFEVQDDLKKVIDEKLGQSGSKLRLDSYKNMEMADYDNENNDMGIDNDDVGNDSFMALEMMCNKTASDPESTLFQYMHSDCKENVLANVKQRQSQERQEEPLMFNGKMLNANELVFADETQLADIEEPSKFWEQTILCGNSMLPTSPVKMVGMLRPSTIMEEKDEDYSQNSSTSMSSHVSNDHDNRNIYSTAATTSTYETAADTTSSTQTKSEMPFYSLRNSFESVASMNCKEFSPTKSVSTVKEAPVNFSKTDSLHDDSVIEILSDDEGSLNGIISPSIEHLNSDISDLLNLTTSTFDANDDCDKENCATALKIPEENISREFNDTMEEVEYMMKKGMEIMAGAAKQQLLQEHAQPVAQHEKKCNKILLKASTTPNRLLTPKKKTSPKKTPSMQHKFKIKANEYSASSISSPPTFVIKPVPKFEMKFKSNEINASIFKRPMPGSATKPNGQQLRKAKQFEHIVSPIGMYVKNTTNTPLMTNMNSKHHINHNAHHNHHHHQRDLMDTSVFRNLEKNYLIDSQQTVAASPLGILPKKAYISSKYKHMVDKRTPITVPGGNSIQQYIQPALLPTVVRHEGKMHLNATATQIPHAVRNIDDSLKDLSIMSGDVSLLTIKTALHIQKK